tara:strand:+ start:2909 stop:3634 length:726 start_codon:yes stop_codon:yes gene_type:complete
MYKNIIIILLLIINIWLVSVSIKKAKFSIYKNLVIKTEELETENEFKVTKELKEHQMKELELLKVFIKLCKEHNIHYVAECGTVLGCIRHGGFIPWDDDIDLALDGEGIKKLLSIEGKLKDLGLKIDSAQKISNPFKSDRNIDQLRYINNSGKDIWIDLFEYEEENGFYYHKYEYLKQTSPKQIYTKQEFENTKLHKFEDIEINIPSNPYKYLRRVYGDWERLVYEPSHEFKNLKPGSVKN